MNKEITDFYEMMIKVFPAKDRGYASVSASEKNIALMSQYMTSLSPKSFGRLISDKHWNSYPLYYHNYYGTNPDKAVLNRSYSSILSFVIKYIIYTEPAHKKILIEKSTGIFRVMTINHCIGDDKRRAARISLKLGDIRARKLAVEILPVVTINKHLAIETNKVVRKKILNRVGYLNITEDQSKLFGNYIKNMVFMNSKFHKDEMDIKTEKILLEAKDKKAKLQQEIMLKISYYIENKDTVFYLDLFQYISANLSYNDKQIFLKKLTGKGVV